ATRHAAGLGGDTFHGPPVEGGAAVTAAHELDGVVGAAASGLVDQAGAIEGKRIHAGLTAHRSPPGSPFAQLIGVGAPLDDRVRSGSVAVDRYRGACALRVVRRFQEPHVLVRLPRLQQNGVAALNGDPAAARVFVETVLDRVPGAVSSGRRLPRTRLSAWIRVAASDVVDIIGGGTGGVGKKPQQYEQNDAP